MKKKLLILFILPMCLLLGGTILSSFNNQNYVVMASESVEADEFISYWRSEVRGKYPDICSMGKDDYNKVFTKYISLNTYAKSIVDTTIDVDNYTIKDSMTSLINKFSNQQKQSSVFTLNKDTTLTIIVVVGVLGMTSIAGFYYMKTKNVIE